MKKVLSFLSISAILIFSACSSSKQATASLNTESFKVSGVCGMCKKRIETAAYGIAGVKSAVWSSKTQSLTVSYDSKKANNEAIQKRVAAAGHDTEKVKAADTAYGKLPDCCKYRDGVEVHDD